VISTLDLVILLPPRSRIGIQPEAPRHLVCITNEETCTLSHRSDQQGIESFLPMCKISHILCAVMANVTS